MHRGTMSVEGEAEEMTVSPGPRYGQRHGKRCNPYSTIGVDKFESVYADLSAKRASVANKIGVPEAMVRFVSSNKGWIPVIIGTGKKNSGGDAAGVSILEPVEKSNSLNHEQERPHLDNSKAKKVRRPGPMDNRPQSTRPLRSVQRSDSFERRSKAAMAYDSRVGATIMVITLLCLVLYGRVCAILLTCAWLYVVPMLRESSEKMREMNRNTEILTVYLQSNEYKKKVILDGFLDRTHK